MKRERSSPIRSDMEPAGRELLACLYEAILGDGHIDPEGKTEDQLMAEVRQAALKWTKLRPMMWSTDFKQDLLSRARNLKREQRDHEAILYYGTWFEHWINGVLIRRLHALNDREACQMIRDVGMRGKLTWLLALVHGKRIPLRHIKAVLHVCDLRNEFVHHKYKMFDIDSDHDEKKLKEAHRLAEQSVRYLKKFEELHFFKGPARGLLRKLRNTKHDKSQ